MRKWKLRTRQRAEQRELTGGAPEGAAWPNLLAHTAVLPRKVGTAAGVKAEDENKIRKGKAKMWRAHKRRGGRKHARDQASKSASHRSTRR